MRLLLGMPHLNSNSGPLACEPQFAAELRRQGNYVEEVVYGQGDGNRQVRLDERVVRVVTTAKEFRQRLLTAHFDVVHLNTSFDRLGLLRDAATLRIIGRTPARVFLKFHGSDAGLLRTRNPLLRKARDQVLSRADGIGLLSGEERENFMRFGVDARKLFPVKNVVEGNPHAPTERFRKRLGISAGVPLVLFISRFIPAKGLVDFVRACRIVNDAEVSFLALCVGHGPDRERAERLVEELGSNSYVRFCGLVTEQEATEFYANCACLVLPTFHFEGFPMAIFKSVAAGLPIITTRIRAAADYLREPENCLWVEPRNPEMIAKSMIRLLRDRKLASRMSENNRRLAGLFSAEKVVDEYVKIYEGLVSEAALASTNKE